MGRIADIALRKREEFRREEEKETYGGKPRNGHIQISLAS